MNVQSILVFAAVVVLIVLAVTNMKKGKRSCCGDCRQCGKNSEKYKGQE